MLSALICALLSVSSTGVGVNKVTVIKNIYTKEISSNKRVLMPHPKNFFVPVFMDIGYQVQVDLKFSEVGSKTYRDFDYRPEYSVNDFGGFSISVGLDTPKMDSAVDDYMNTVGQFAGDLSDTAYQYWASVAVDPFPKVNGIVSGYNLQYKPMQDAKKDGWTSMKVEHKVADFYGDASLYRITRLAGEAEKKELVSNYEIPYGRYYLPEKPVTNFYSDRNEWGMHYTGFLDKIGGIEFTSEYSEKIGFGGLPIPRLSLNYDFRKDNTTNPNKYLTDSAGSFGAGTADNIITRSGLDRLQILGMMQHAAAKGDSMNALNFPGDPDKLGPVTCGSEVVFPPGTFWIPDKPGYQTMMNFTNFKHNFEPSLSVNGSVAFSEMRSHCLNMDRKEPDKNVSYFPYVTPDPILRELARIAEASRFRGPWEQARTWIYTDKASLEQINKRLFPGVSHGQYVNGLWDVTRLGGFSERELKDKKLFDPVLLSGAGASDEAMMWFTTHMAMNFGRDVRSWLERNPSELREMASSSAKDTEKSHVIRLLKVLLGTRNLDARMGALGFLSKLQTGREVLRDQIGSLRMSLYSNDVKEVELALQVSEMYHSKPPKDAILYLAKNGKSDQIKELANRLRSRI